VVTGGDSGIGRAVSIAFAKEGADVAIAYLSEDEDADAGLDILVNNVATQHPVDDLRKLSSDQLERTFRVNIFSYFWVTRAVLALTYSLAQSIADRGIRVNCVAPGPVWTPLIPATFPREKVEKFGQQVPMSRAAQPDEIAPSYVFFAAPQLSSYYSGEVLTPVGGETMPG
jgi:NAD(P)-dependent dehydrogenase (short-subunit alcohol dehydrogenase family)